MVLQRGDFGERMLKVVPGIAGAWRRLEERARLLSRYFFMWEREFGENEGLVTVEANGYAGGCLDDVER